jgi:hypothetical protein
MFTSPASNYFNENDPNAWPWNNFSQCYSLKNLDCPPSEILYQYKLNLRKFSKCKEVSNVARSKSG